MDAKDEDAMNYAQFFDLESYLLNTVKERFQKDRCLSAFDFFCIVIWKSNRAKSKIAKKLLEKGYETLDDAAKALTSGLAEQSSNKERLRYLVEEWGLRLPMASAVLTILYPEDFTVYDARVCEALNDFHNLDNITPFDRMWSSYEDYLRAVKQNSPDGLTLREKDRYLWGRSFHGQLCQDISNGFRAKKPE